MKRTSVVYNVTPSYSHNAQSARASASVRKTSCLVQTVGIILIIIIALFILKNAESVALLSLGLISGNPFDEGEQDDDLWKIILLGIFLLGGLFSVVYFIF